MRCDDVLDLLEAYLADELDGHQRAALRSTPQVVQRLPSGRDAP